MAFRGSQNLNTAGCHKEHVVIGALQISSEATSSCASAVPACHCYFLGAWGEARAKRYFNQ